MKALRAIGAELLGLFVEDWVFALAIAAWLAIVGVASGFGVGAPELRGATLFAGLALILIASVARAARVK